MRNLRHFCHSSLRKISNFISLTTLALATVKDSHRRHVKDNYKNCKFLKRISHLPITVLQFPRQEGIQDWLRTVS